MTTIHARQIHLTKMQVRKTNKVLYIFSNIFFPPYCTHVFTPVLRFSPLYHPYISFPLHPAFTPSLRCTSLHFPPLHFTTIFYTFRWFSLHFTSLHFTSLHFTSLHFLSLLFLHYSYGSLMERVMSFQRLTHHINSHTNSSKRNISVNSEYIYNIPCGFDLSYLYYVGHSSFLDRHWRAWHFGGRLHSHLQATAQTIRPTQTDVSCGADIYANEQII